MSKEQPSQIIIYQAKDGKAKLDVRLEDETVWLTQEQMADLFQIDKSGISRHLKNIFESGELKRDSVVAIFATTATDGKTYQVEYFNLDAIISVGYRVNSICGTQFRIWATQRIKEYIIKGFTLDDERLKQGGQKARYFQELLQRIRDIRSSERNFYQKITDIYSINHYAEELELENLKKSADLYSEIYSEDHELKELTDATVSGWPE